MRLTTRILFFALVLFVMTSASAFAYPSTWICIGTCGNLGPNGVVTSPPGGGNYDYVTTQGSGNNDGGLGISLTTNVSRLRSSTFSATGGDALEFDFNYVTSDGGTYADYAWARLLDSVLNPVAILFTARTTTSGNTSPGFGLPANSATLTPPTSPIIPGGVTWSPLDPNDSPCYAAGCGYTGWIHSSYTIQNSGNYILEFGVANYSDTLWNSGLAFAGTQVGGRSIQEDPVPTPEPVSMGLLALGLIGLVPVARKVRS